MGSETVDEKLLTATWLDMEDGERGVWTRQFMRSRARMKFSRKEVSEKPNKRVESRR